MLLCCWLFLAGCGSRSPESDGLQVPRGEDSVRIRSLDTEGLKAFLGERGPALLEFGGHRCISCVTMRGYLQEIGKSYPSLRIGCVYWEDTPELLTEWKIGIIPAQILFDEEGREILRHVGVWEIEEIEDALSRAGIKSSK